MYFQKATEKVRKEEKDELYRKLLDTYEARKKMGLSSDLTRKLRRRRKLRRMRHHRKSKREFISLSFKSISSSFVKHNAEISFLIWE